MNDADVKELLDGYVGTPPADPFDVERAIQRGRRRRTVRTTATWTAAVLAVGVLAGSVAWDRQRGDLQPVVTPGVDDVQSWCSQAFVDGSDLAAAPAANQGTRVVRCRMDSNLYSDRFDVTISESTGPVSDLLSDLARPSPSLAQYCTSIAYPQDRYVVVSPNHDPVFVRKRANGCDALIPRARSMQQAAFVTVGTFPLQLPGLTPTPTPAAVVAEMAQIKRALVPGSPMQCWWQTSTEGQVANLPRTDPTRPVYVVRCTGNFQEYGSGVGGNSPHTGSLIYAWTYISGQGSGLWSEDLVKDGATPNYPSITQQWIPAG